MLKLKVLPAEHGDSIIIQYGTTVVKNIIIDGGAGISAYRALKKEIEYIAQANQSIDLLVITHIDEDHILGIIDIFQDSDIDKNLIKKTWFNSGNAISKFLQTGLKPEREIPLASGDTPFVSVSQGKTLENEMLRYECWDQNIILVGHEEEYNYGKFTVLSPDLDALKKLNRIWPPEEKQSMISGCLTDYDSSLSYLITQPFLEDRSPRNASSIAFLFEFYKKKLLLLGDSFPSIVESSLRKLGFSEDNKLRVDITKVAHHGSKMNTSDSLLRILDCKNYVLSTDGTRHGFPHKTCLGRIVSNQPGAKMFFNYPHKQIFLKQDLKEYDFSCEFLDNVDYTIVLED